MVYSTTWYLIHKVVGHIECYVSWLKANNFSRTRAYPRQHGASLPAPVQPGLPLLVESGGERGHESWAAPSELRRAVTVAAVVAAAADDASLKLSSVVLPLPLAAAAVAAVALVPHKASESVASGSLLSERERERVRERESEKERASIPPSSLLCV